MPSAREIKLTILGDASDATKALDDVEQKSGRMGGAVGKAGLALAGLGATAGLAAVGGIAKSIMSFTEAGDALDEMSSRTGFSVESLSELKYAAELSGGSLEGFEKSTLKMAKVITAAEDGAQGAKDSLKELGVTTKDLKGLKPEDQFALLASKLADVDDDTRKAAIATEIFGKSGTALLPMLEEGGAGLEEMRQKARDLGVVMSGEDAKSAAQFADMIDNAKAKVTGFMFAVAREAIPVLQKFAAWFQAEALPRLQEFAAFIEANVIPMLLAFAGFFTENIIPAAQRLADFLLDVFNNKIRPLIEEFTARARAEFAKWGAMYDENLKPAFDNIVRGIEFVVGFFAEHWPQIAAIVGPVFEQVKNIVDTAMDVIRGVINLVLDLIAGDWSGAWNDVKGILDTIWTGIQRTIENGIEFIKGVLGAAIPAFLEVAGRLGGALKDGLVAGLKAGADLAVDLGRQLANALIGIINSQVIDSINRGLEFEVLGVNVNAPDIPHIPSFDKGGIVPGPLGAPTLAVVHGGERVVPPGQGGGFNLTLIVEGDLLYQHDLERRIEQVVTRAARNGMFRGTPIGNTSAA